MTATREIITVSEVAGILGCSPSQVRKILNGRVHGVPPLPHIKLGKIRRVRKSILMEWIAGIEGKAELISCTE